MRTTSARLATAYAVGLALLVFSPVSDLLNRLTIELYVIWVGRLHLPGDVTPATFEAGLNVLLFVPIGALVVLLARRAWWQGALACLLLSGAIETIQAIPLVHRDASLVDVATNTLGGLLGALGADWWRTRNTDRS